MYNACRHIKSSGDRCKSPALHEKNFCFFHDRLHTDAIATKFDTLRLPVAEDFSSILLALNRISNAIINSRIDSKRAAQLIWIQQPALQVVNRRDSRNDESIQTIAQNALGEELAPPLSLCEPGDECQTCVHNKICARSPYADPYEADDETEYQYEHQDPSAPDSSTGREDDGDEDDRDEQDDDSDGDSGEDENEDEDDDDEQGDDDSEDDDDEEEGDDEGEDEDDDDEQGDDDSEDDDGEEEGGDEGEDEDADDEQGDDDSEDDDDEEEGDDEDEDEGDDDEDGLDNETTEELAAGAKHLESITEALKNDDMRTVERLLKE
jgi:hypothetical protein